MKTRCKVCLSHEKSYIEEMITDKVPLKTISERMLSVYGEQISRDAIARHRDHHMVEAHSNSDRVQETVKPEKRGGDEARSNEVTEAKHEEVVAEKPLSQMEALEARINNIEVVMAEERSTGSFTAFRSYTIAGETVHKISYKDLILSLHPKSGSIHNEYLAIAARIKAKRVLEGGLILSDESFVKPRAELNKKNQEEAEKGLAEAMVELEKREADKVKFRQALEQLAMQEKRNAQ
jgi:hypothetical protein